MQEEALKTHCKIVTKSHVQTNYETQAKQYDIQLYATDQNKST
jgi:hypothetical protein